VALKKPSDFFGKKEEDSNLPVVESDNSLRDELSKVESLSEQVVQLQQELSQKVVKNDLESLVLSQINTMQENFDYLQKEFKQSNKKDIREFKDKVTELTNIIGNLVENEFPKYKKQITNNELRIGDKFDQLKEVVSENIVEIREDIDSKIENIAFAIDENLEFFDQRLKETSTEVKDTVNTYNKLSKIVESRISKENEQLEEYSKVIQSLYEAFLNLENSIQEDNTSNLQTIEDKFGVISLSLDGKLDNFNEDIGSFKDHISSEILDIKADVVVFEKHNKDTEKLIQEFSEKLNTIPSLNESIKEVQTNIGELKSQYEDVANQSSETKKDLEVVERYIQNHHQDIEVLKEEVFSEIEKLPVGNLQENLNRLEKKIDYIKETYSKIEPEVLVREVIKEGLLNIPPDEKSSDPLTPLNQNFVTLDQLQEHYRLFINRIQQQLATLGGGGETRLRFLDDVIGVATNPGAYDGKYLQWNSTTNTAEFTNVTGAGVQVNSDWNATVGVSSILNKPTIVNQIIAGTGITISPSNGIGTVTISATGIGTTNIGYYGSFYDTTTQATGIASTSVVKLNSTAASNGFNIQNGSKIVAEYAGVYNTQFSLQLDKASGATGNIWIWLSKNGVDLPDTNTTIAVQGTNAENVAAWNFIIDMIAGDYIEYKWMSDDANMQLLSSGGVITSVGNPPISVNIPAIPSAIVTIQQIAGVVAGTGSTTQTLDQTLGYGNTSSRGFSVGVASVTTLSGVGNTFIGLSTSIVPTIPSRISLGTSAFPFKDIVISAGTLTIADTDPLTDGVAISNTNQYLQLSRGGFKILSGIGTLFQIDPFTALVTSAAPTIITNTDNTSGVGSGALQVAGGGYIAKDLRVGGGFIGSDGASFTGIVTANSFSGSGSNLTGIVTYITAGSGISVNQNTGNVTITATGAGTQNLNTTLGYGNTSSIGMSVGVSTFTDAAGRTVVVGGPNTALVVNDNVRVTGVSTFGTTNTVVVGGPNTALVVNDAAHITTVLTAARTIVTANNAAQTPSLSVTGTVYSNPNKNGLFSVGQLGFNDTDLVANFDHNVNGYAQIIFQNKNSGTQASTDFIVANDSGGANSYYGDFGINASGFVGSSVWDDPNGTYLYASAGSLSLGTDDAKDVRIARGSASN